MLPDGDQGHCYVLGRCQAGLDNFSNNLASTDTTEIGLKLPGSSNALPLWTGVICEHFQSEDIVPLCSEQLLSAIIVYQLNDRYSFYNVQWQLAVL